MLIQTEDAVFVLRGESCLPQPLFTGGPVSVAEGRTMDVIAFGDGRLLTGRESHWNSTEIQIPESVHSMAILREDPLLVAVGTGPPFLYLFNGENCVQNESFAQLSCRVDWHTPWGGPAAVRSIAVIQDGTVYADIHVGSIMKSSDRGETWCPVTPGLDEDVHEVAICPAAPDFVYANTARAVFVSENRGRSWHDRGEGLGHRYGRAIAIHPRRPQCILATVSDGPHGENVHGQLWRTDDGGEHWSHVQQGFPPSTSGNINTFHVVFDQEGYAWACVGRELFFSKDEGLIWHSVWQAPEVIVALSCAPV